MKTNEELLSKEALQKGIFPSTIDFSPEEAATFLTALVDQSEFMKRVRVEKMSKETKNIRWLGLGANELLHPGEGFSQDDYIKQLAHQKLQLVAKKLRGCVVVDDDALEDNIEGAAFTNHLMNDLIAPQAANEQEELYLIGDKATPPTKRLEVLDGVYNLILDGAQAGDQAVLKKPVVYDGSADEDPYVVSPDANSVYGWRFKFQRMINGLLPKYRKTKELAFFTSPGVEQDYRMALAARGTSVGDEALLRGGGLVYNGIPVVGLPLLPDTMGTGADETFILLTWAQNVIIGLHRALKLETERVPSDESTRFWFSIRTDLVIGNLEACVLYKKVKARGV